MRKRKAAEGKKLPIRIYPCSACRALHLTSVAEETRADVLGAWAKDRRLQRQLEKRQARALPEGEP